MSYEAPSEYSDKNKKPTAEINSKCETGAMVPSVSLEVPL